MATHAYVLIPHESLMLDKIVKCPSGTQQIPLFVFVFSQRPASCCCFCVVKVLHSRAFTLSAHVSISSDSASDAVSLRVDIGNK